MVRGPKRLAVVLAWIAIVLPAIEAVARQLTRTRPIGLLPENPLALAALPVAGLALWAAAARPWRRATVTVLAALFASGLALQLHFGARLQSDGFYYYAYLRSIAFDHDVNFLNDYAMLGQTDKPQLFEPTATGHAHSAWTIGPAIVWSPFFAVGHLAATRLAAGGADVAVDGTSYPYRQAVCIAGLAYALLGAWFAFGLAREFTTPRRAALATALVLGGSFMTWYALVEPTMTHAPSMAVVAGFAWLWVRTLGRRTPAGWVLLGALAGLAGLIRWQNVLFALLPAAEAGTALSRAIAARDWPAARRTAGHGLAFMAAATIAFVPQMIAWQAIYGAPFAVSPLGPAIDPLHPHLVDVLFSSRNGLFAMSPVLYVAALGGLGFTLRRPAVGVPILAACAVMAWFNASIYDWWGSDGYGGRRFDGVVPLLVPGMAVALAGLQGVVARRPRLVAGGVVAALVLWNLTFMGAAQQGLVRLGEPVEFGAISGVQARTLHHWFGHPASYPVNLWFAARHAVPPGDWDLLSAYRFLGDRTRPYGQVDVGGDDGIYVGEGWHAPERDGDRSFRWATREAVLLIPLDHAAPLDVRIRLRAFAPPGAPPQAVTIDTGRATFGPIEVPADWGDITVATDAAAWTAGLTRLRLRFAWAATPADLLGNGDTRALAAGVDNVRVAVRDGDAR
ncbi:MAG: glycosyltransferase family 39 protein [Vicinamibacterales bacterium]